MNKKLLQSICYGFAHEFNNSIFKLKMPFVIVVTKDKKFENSGYAEWSEEFYEGDSIFDSFMYHQVKISFGYHYHDLQELKSTIFHEFVHGWQFEQKLEVEHDKNFWAWEKIANNLGLTLRFPDDNFADFS